MFETLALSLALGTLQAPLAATAQRKTQSQIPAPAQVAGPRVPLETWMRILNTVKNNGEFTPPAPGSNVGTWTIEDLSVDPLGEYTHRYLDIIAAPLTSDAMQIASATFTGMKITETATERRAEIWYFRTDFQGRLKLAGRSTASGPLNGEMKVSAPVELDLNDPKVQARYDAIIKLWAKH